MIRESDKKAALALIQEACQAGARKRLAAELLGLPLRTVQRWEAHGINESVDLSTILYQSKKAA